MTNAIAAGPARRDRAGASGVLAGCVGLPGSADAFWNFRHCLRLLWLHARDLAVTLPNIERIVYRNFAKNQREFSALAIFFSELIQGTPFKARP